MILCLNPNAAIDKTVIVSSYKLGQIHRPESVSSLPGGKGCNVARALQQLGEKPVVSGWVGGSAGQFIKNGLSIEGISSDFIYTDFESRTCLSILDRSTQAMTEIYEKGDPVPPEKIQEMKERFGQIIGDFAAVTFSGSLPPGVPTNFYADLIAIAQQAGVPAFLDSSGEALKQGVEAKPYLIKPNETEVAILAGRELKDLDDYISAASSLSSSLGSNIVLSLGKDGAVAASKGETALVKNPQVAARSAVGSGDCTLAGVTYGILQGYSLQEAVKYGVAAGTANTLLIGAGRFHLDDFQQILAQTEIIPLS